MPRDPLSSAAPIPAQLRLRANLADFSLLMLFAFVMLGTNRFFTFIDDEVNILGPAARPTARCHP